MSETDHRVGYALRSEFDDGTFAGTVTYGARAHMVSVHELLEAGDGIIATEDALLTAALDNYPALKRVKVPGPDHPTAQLPEGAEPSVESGQPSSDEQLRAAMVESERQAAHARRVAAFDRLKKDELVEMADDHDVDVASSATKPEVIDALIEAEVPVPLPPEEGAEHDDDANEAAAAEIAEGANDGA